MMRTQGAISVFLLLLFTQAAVAFDYKDALTKSILFYEAQRSGKLPSDQRASWRSDSGLFDGRSQGVDLVGGYYDAGDNVKFGLPMAYTITMMSWSAIEYQHQLQSSGQYSYALDAIKWGTDYLIKAHPQPNVLWGEVGDGFSDHLCWQRPEDMTTSRQAYKIDASNPGSDLAGETAAALAAASIVYKRINPRYSSLLLSHAKQLFAFADTHRGKYDSSIPVAQKFYNSRSGYADEILWGAMWLHEATQEDYYLKFVVDNAGSLGGTGWAIKEFSWDVKYAGVQVLAAKLLLQGKAGRYASVLKDYQSKAEFFLCACLQKNNGNDVQRTPGGLMYVRSWNNMQYATSASFLLTVYSDYLLQAKQQLQCPNHNVESGELLSLAKSQVDYILGDNPRATSYMVGFGSNFPQQVHHRASSIVSYKSNPSFVSCRGGYATWYSRRQRDPNVLVGAVVGGPDQYDNFADQRDNWEQTEPATYNNGPLLGVLARLYGGVSPHHQQPHHPPHQHPHHPPHQHPHQQHHHPHKEHPHKQHPHKDHPHKDHPHKHPHDHTHQHSQLFSPDTLTELEEVAGGTVALRQSVVATWSYKMQNYYKYEVNATNETGERISELNLKIKGVKENSIWGVRKTSNRDDDIYTFPTWLKSLSAGESFVFVYIQTAAASMEVWSYKFI